MPKKKEFKDHLFDEVFRKGLGDVLRQIAAVTDNPNVPLAEEDVETATFLRDTIRAAVKHRQIVKQPIFKREP